MPLPESHKRRREVVSPDSHVLKLLWFASHPFVLAAFLPLRRSYKASGSILEIRWKMRTKLAGSEESVISYDSV
jgi:hypothetical protein